MNNEEEMKGEIVRLKKEIERMRLENTGINQGMIKKKAEVAGDMTELGVFEEELCRVGMANGFDKEEIKISSYFSMKGHRLEREKVCRCSFCSIILTEGEKIESNNNVYCEKCYRREEHDLDKDGYKILVCIYNDYKETSTFLEYLGYVITLQKLTGLTKSEVNKKIEKLLGEGYLFLHGLVFKELRVSSKGEEALAAYDQIYRDSDCNAVKDRVFYMGA